MAERIQVLGAAMSLQILDLADGLIELHQDLLALSEDSAVFDSVCHSRKDLVFNINGFAFAPVIRLSRSRRYPGCAVIRAATMAVAHFKQRNKLCTSLF